MDARAERMIERALLDLLSDAIVERLRARDRSALVLLSGTDLGLRAATASLARLSAKGWRLEIHRSLDAAGLIGSAQLLELSGGTPPRAPSNAPLGPEDIDRCLSRNALVLVPCLSLPLASRVARGLTDAALPGLMAGALERGCRVIAAREGVCPNGRDRQARGRTGTPAYRAMLTDTLETLAGFGAELVWASQIAEAVIPGSAAEPERTASQVFGWNEAKTVAGDTLRLPRNVLITPLAAEELRARHVRLVRE